MILDAVLGIAKIVFGLVLVVCALVTVGIGLATLIVPCVIIFIVAKLLGV